MNTIKISKHDFGLFCDKTIEEGMKYKLISTITLQSTMPTMIYERPAGELEKILNDSPN